jgi:hypothetical protein
MILQLKYQGFLTGLYYDTEKTMQQQDQAVLDYIRGLIESPIFRVSESSFQVLSEQSGKRTRPESLSYRAMIPLNAVDSGLNPISGSVTIDLKVVPIYRYNINHPQCGSIERKEYLFTLAESTLT